jgi:hypothetical protein
MSIKMYNKIALFLPHLLSISVGGQIANNLKLEFSHNQDRVPITINTEQFSSLRDCLCMAKFGRIDK